MAKTVDISSKRLISLAPTPWVRWLTGDTQAEAQELLGNELQFVSRANDLLELIDFVYNAGSLDDVGRRVDELLGQAHFFRNLGLVIGQSVCYADAGQSFLAAIAVAVRRTL